MIAEDLENDICILSVFGLNKQPAPLVSSSDLIIGQDVYAIGSPAGLELTLSSGIVSSIRNVGRIRVIQTSASLSHGSSGGGLFDSKGNLIGITTFAISNAQNLNFAIPAEVVLKTLESSKAEIEKDTVKAKRLKNSFPNEPNWGGNENPYDASLHFIVFSTPQDVWSSEGAFGLKWGMGPADVTKVMPKIIVLKNTRHTQIAIVPIDLLGKKTNLILGFIQGRLNKIEVALDESKIPLDYRFGEQWRADANAWRESIRTTIEESFGKPLCAPTEKIKDRYCYNGRTFQKACGDSKLEKMQLRWVWRTAETQVEIFGRFSRLIYSDLLMIDAQKQADAAQESFIQNEKRNRQAIEKQFIGGKTNFIANSTDDSSDVELLDFTRPIPPLQCYSDPGVEAKTDPVSWSSSGWEKFKWGMGPADVINSLKITAGYSWYQTDSDRDADVLIVDHFGDLEFDKKLALPFYDKQQFRFVNSRLTSIRIEATCKIDHKKQCIDWEDGIRKKLNTQFGMGRCVPIKGVENCHWDYTNNIWADLKVHAEDSNWYEHLEIEDPEGKPVKVSVASSKKQHKSSFSNIGRWNQFSWGMGIQDVNRILKMKQGPFKVAEDISCYSTIGTKDSRCHIESALHKFKLEGQTPALTFYFEGGGLVDVRIHFDEFTYFDDCIKFSDGIKEKFLSEFGQFQRDFSRGNHSELVWDSSKHSVLLISIFMQSVTMRFSKPLLQSPTN